MAISTTRGRAASRRRSRGPIDELPAEPLPIGDPDMVVIGCPVCGRPIVAGSGRCSGCGTRFIIGVPMRRASTFIALGVVLGMLLGAGVASAFQPARTTGGGSGSNGAGTLPAESGATSTAGPSPTAPATALLTPAAPGPALAAMSQLPAIHLHLATDASALRHLLASKAADGIVLADAVRSVNSDAAIASDLATRLVGWPAAAAIRSELQGFYQAVRSAATDGLAASVSNTAAYRSAGATTLAVLDGLDAIDADLHAFARVAGVTLPAMLAAGP